MKRLVFSALASAMFLSACGSDGSSSSNSSAVNTQASSSATASPCFANDCAEILNVATIPDAENMAFGPDGKLYVTGGTDVFRIDLNNGAYTATPLSDGGCNFTGITFIDNQLYAACGNGSLWTGNLSSQPFVVKPFYQIQGLGLANGLVESPKGDALLLADGPIPTNYPLAMGKIIKIKLSGPGVAAGDEVWLNTPGRYPNGLQRKGNSIFISETVPPSLGQISSVGYGSDGMPSGNPQLLVSLPSFPDDFSLLPDGFAVTLFFDGSIAKYTFDGNLQSSTMPGTFETGTSQIRVGQGADFEADDVLVTIKGLIGDTFSPIGNKLVVFRRVND